MKRIAVILMLLMSSAVFATNGDNMIGAGSISRAMGGTGIAYAMGSESLLKNPSLITTTKGNFELSFGGMIFKPEVTGTYGPTTAKSKADSFVIPAVGFTYRLSDRLVFGIGAYGVSGLGVDYRDESGLMKMSTGLNLMKFAPAIAYQSGNFSFGAGLSIMYGTLSIAYSLATDAGPADYRDIGRGVSDDLGIGFDLGMAYQLNDFTFGLNYQSAIEMEYKHQIANSGDDFNLGSVISTDLMEQPAEYGAGVAYALNGFDVTFDYKIIAWSKAAGYKDFGWEDQNVMAVGVAYHLGETVLRLGYNHAETPLKESAIGNTGATQAVNFFNAIGFPASAETHYTLGASHQFSEIFGMDFSYVLSPETTITGKFDSDGPGANPEMDIKTTHKESSLSVAGRWAF